MKPDKKYMSQVSKNDTKEFNFTPPVFNASLFRDESLKNNNNSDDYSSNLFPSETQSSETRCYYNDFDDYSNENSNITYNSIMPSPFDILRNFDLDLDETTDLERDCYNTDIDKIYLEIEQNNPGILSTLCEYGIPCPISKVIIKRLIKLSLLYCNKK